jgi:polyhydroxybutyrate depolymerase
MRCERLNRCIPILVGVVGLMGCSDGESGTVQPASAPSAGAGASASMMRPVTAGSVSAAMNPAVSAPPRTGGASGTPGSVPMTTAGTSGSTDPGSMASANETPAGPETPDGGMTPSSPKPGKCDGTGALKAGNTDMSTMIAGENRTFIVHVPSKYDGMTPMPLMLNFHPYAFGTAMGQLTGSGFAELGDAEGFISAFPQGMGNQWDLGKLTRLGNDDDDRNFALKVVEILTDTGCVDTKRVYASGYSMGAGLTHYLACREAGTFAAVGTSAFDLIKENLPCEPSHPMPIIMFRGTGDPIVPFDGGVGMLTGPPATFPGAQMTFKMWADIDKCTDEPMPVTDLGAPNCSRYSKCDGGVQVTLCINMGHTQGPAPAIWKAIKDFSLP